MIRARNIGINILLLMILTGVLGAQENSAISAPGSYVPDEIIIKFRSSDSGVIGGLSESSVYGVTSGAASRREAVLENLGRRFQLDNATQLGQGRRGRAAVEVPGGRTGRGRSGYQGANSHGSAVGLNGNSHRGIDGMMRLRFRLRSGETLDDILEMCNNDPEIEYAERNYIVSAFTTPNDPDFGELWAMNNANDADVDGPEGWEIGTGSTDVVVAVIDTGVYYEHRDLAANMWFNEAERYGDPNVDDDNNGFVDDIWGYDFINDDVDPNDDKGHGTHCAGTIAAVGNNGVDITGVCWNARIMAVKFLGADGRGDTADAIEAIVYAVDNGADILSNSWGGGGDGFIPPPGWPQDWPQSLNEAVQYAHDQGVVVVAAAGNNKSDNETYPAAYDNVIAVAATDQDDHRATFSNYGDWVDIAAPGVDILSLRAIDADTSNVIVYNDYLMFASGTSMACPHVAGAAALLLSMDPCMTAEEVEDFLIDSGDDISDTASGICRSNKRLVLFTNSVASLRFQQDSYTCASNVSLRLADRDLIGQSTQSVTLETAAGDYENASLSHTGMGVFTGTFPTSVGDPIIGDGYLQLSNALMITATYSDANEAGTDYYDITATAIADCNYPVVNNVHVDVMGENPIITFQTDQPTTAVVHCSTLCYDPCAAQFSDSVMALDHIIELSEIEPDVSYHFTIHATDLAGNTVIDDANNGECYTFKINDNPLVFYVPSQYATIQDAVSAAPDGGTIRLADGTYTGPGNRDIELNNRTLTIISENGPENCIIDCEGNQSQVHRAFTIIGGGESDTVISNITIANGYAPLEDIGMDSVKRAGSAIFCRDSSPLISGCVFSGNTGDYGTIACYGTAANPHIDDCSITGGILSDAGAGTAIFCGGESRPLIENCSITHNAADAGVIAIVQGSIATIQQCSIKHNTGIEYGGGVYIEDANAVIVNSIIADNTADYGAGIFAHQSYTIIENCTFGGNAASVAGGAMFIEGSEIELSNSILWYDEDPNAKEIAMFSYESLPSSLEVSYCDIQGGSSGIYSHASCELYMGAGIIDVEPIFVQPPDGNTDPNDWNFHLSSAAGRWRPEFHQWVADAETSPCIDAGDPCQSPVTELWPNGQRSNIGAYGCTFEASMSLSTQGNIADMNYDNTVDIVDLAEFVSEWLSYDPLSPQNLDHDPCGIVNLEDFVIFQMNYDP